MTTQRLLAERLNVEPRIFRGCTSSELGTIVGLAIAVWLPLSVVIAWLLGAPSMGLGLAGGAIVVSVIVVATVLQRLKRGRPEAYYRHQFTLRLAELGLIRSPFITRQGDWGLGRTTAIAQ
jgi:conjugative transfer region protein (TIGR03750 family)